MRWRVPVAVLLAVALGVGAGWLVAASREPDRDARGPVAAAITPIPATPSVPVEAPTVAPGEPALEAGVEKTTQRLTYPAEGDPDYTIELPTPSGWRESDDQKGRWYFTLPLPDDQESPYGLRVDLLALQPRSVDRAISVRIAALKSADAQGSLSDFSYDLDPTGDGFDATFKDGNGQDRVNYERFFAGPDGNAVVTVAVYGRDQDERGLEDLISLVTKDITFTTPEG